jgi:hypothetical protein
MNAHRHTARTVAAWQAQYRDLGFRKVALWIAESLVSCVTGAPLLATSRITPQLHLGGQYSRRGWPILARRGITAVVNLRAEFDDSVAGIAPPRYLYLPTADNEPPSQEQLREGIAFVSQEIARGGGVYIHCHAGTGRAATVTAAYLTTTGLTPDEAWGQVRRARPFVCPTPAQARQVDRLAHRA